MKVHAVINYFFHILIILPIGSPRSVNMLIVSHKTATDYKIYLDKLASIAGLIYAIVLTKL